MKTYENVQMICPGMPLLVPNGIISMVQHQIKCEEKDEEDGRTHFIEYWIRGKEVTVLHGMRFDSDADYESMEKINEHLRELQKESDIKQHRSAKSMGKIILNA